MTSHPNNVANFLNDVERGVDPKIASRFLDRELTHDSVQWIRAGVGKMYPNFPENKVIAAFDRAYSKYNDLNVNFLEAFEKEIKMGMPSSSYIFAAYKPPMKSNSQCSLKILRAISGH